ncbi:LysR family transcriptional regulator [Streptomyces sudanensis]|uniref:LysR family transcriptional regulator n=1 Tax=Streptomyces sudanensis TaxID=436397 RepID=UPI0020CE4D92|nr:LysR family transcriptional regulator [Streptomyces sudanensis]MCP9959447.1 LysR family transcriptional regulator [Streptomyces sudanensis]MCP9988517.1 LysR family transcriptional regulator [Streptomyces sudanensis]MCQ0000104.1 LysR family transcriptional regulator [Streptomyces sudanensis]
MELRQMEYFVAVAEEFGLRSAAERLGAAEAEVDHRIGELERELDLRLFDRGSPPGRLRLTAAGEYLLPGVRAALAAVGRVRETAAGVAAGTEGLVRLGSSRAFADRVYRATGALAERRPGLRVRLERAPQEGRLAAVRSGTFDAALVRTVRRAEGVVLHPVWTEPLLAALPAGHPLASLEEPHPSRLARLPLRLVPRETDPALYDLVVSVLPDWTPGPPFTTLRATLDALATAAEPSWTVFHPAGPLPRDRRLVFRPLGAPRVPVSLAVRPGRPAPAVAALLEALTAAGPPRGPASRSGAAPPAPAPRTAGTAPG